MHAHPSNGHGFDDDDDEEASLPEGVTEEQVRGLVETITEEANGIGLYAAPMVQAHCQGDTMLLVMQFRIGDVAFLPRVQDPEQDKVDDTFRAIETDNAAQRIKDKFVDGTEDD